MGEGCKGEGRRGRSGWRYIERRQKEGGSLGSEGTPYSVVGDAVTSMKPNTSNVSHPPGTSVVEFPFCIARDFGSCLYKLY